MKKVLSLLMVLAVVVPLFSTTRVYADDNTVVVDGVTFSKNMQILVKYPVDKIDESYTIPKSVAIIGNNAFSESYGRRGNTYLKNIIIPNSVTSIGEYAFSNCTNLESIIIPDSVTTIGSKAFSECTNLESVVLSQNIDSLKPHTFNGCSSLKEITIPENVEDIDHAFTECIGIESVEIPANVTNMWGAFDNCTNLKKVVFQKAMHTFTGFNGCVSLENIIVPDGVNKIGFGHGDGLKGCKSLKCITIPESVTLIVDNAFDGCSSLTDVYYGATEIEWNSIEIGTGNGFLQTANIHFTEPDKNEIKVTLYGKKLSFDQPPVIENGRTLVPLRAIFEALNAEVAWDGETQTVRAIRYGTYIELQIGSNEMKVNNEIKILDVPAKTINDRTMVPARAIAEAFGCNVSWDAENNAVIIN